MFSTKRVWIILGLVITLGLIAAACGEEATPTAVPQATATTDPAAEPTATTVPAADPTATTVPAADPTSTTDPVAEPTATAAPVVSALPPGALSLVEGMPVCEGTAEAIPGGTLRSFGHDPGGFDAQGGDWWAASILQVFTHLRLTQWNFCDPSENSDYAVYPYLAESWEISDDGLQYTFYIREGVKWQNTSPVNGREVTADDVVFSYRRYLEPEATNRSVLGPVESLDALDKYTVQFTLAEPSAVFLTATAFPGFPIYAPEVLDEFGGYDTMESSIGIGAGPWRLAEYEPGIIIALEKNPDFFRGPNGITGENLPYIDRVEFLMVAEAAAGLAL